MRTINDIIHMDVWHRSAGIHRGDNQGIIGLEVQYEKYLKGTDGKILTLTDAAGIELENEAEDRIEPEAGRDLQASLDVNIQMYAEQAAYQTMQKKNANRVSIIVMNEERGNLCNGKCTGVFIE